VDAISVRMDRKLDNLRNWLMGALLSGLLATAGWVVALLSHTKP
jgi:hypothetical protein